MQTQSKESSFLNDLSWCILAVVVINFIAIPIFMFDVTNTTSEFVVKVIVLAIIACGVYKVINYLSMEKES